MFGERLKQPKEKRMEEAKELEEAIESLERLKYAGDYLVCNAVRDDDLELVTQAARRELERLASGKGGA